MKNEKKPTLARYFFDTEFNEKGEGKDVDFISIGIVDEKGSDFYGISNEFNLAAAQRHEWLRVNVVDKLEHHSTWKRVDDIRKGILDLIEPADQVEFWAKNGSYDVVMLCRIFGGMGELRETLKREKGIQRVDFRDTKEVLRIAVNPEIERMKEADKHISINDAHNERYVFTQCQKAIATQNRPSPDVI